MTFVCNVVIFIVHWLLLMLRLCGQLRKNAVHLDPHKCAFCILECFRVHFSKEAWQDQSPREHKSVLCVLGVEKQLRAIYAELNSNPLMCYHGN